jgi:predicted DNA-binding transcriptional regulator
MIVGKITLFMLFYLLVTAMNKEIHRLLRRLGLRDRESRIYLACLRSKEGLFVHELVRETRILRSTVDLTIRRLLQREFLNKSKVGRRTRYFAQDPKSILFRQKQLAEDFETILPSLSVMGGHMKDMEILYFEGAHGFRQVHDDALTHIKNSKGDKKDILSFSSGADSLRLYPTMQKMFIDKRIKNGSWYRAIASNDSRNVPIWNNDPKALREIKYLPSTHYPFRIDIQIYADNIMLYSTTPPIGGVTIRNEKIADSMRALFNLVWKLLPDHAS